MEKQKRGGTRKGSGAKQKYSESTKTISFRCPVSKEEEMKNFIETKLNSFKTLNNDRSI